jgi:hypothetical protein
MSSNIFEPKKNLKLTKSRLSHQAIIDTGLKPSSTSFRLFFYPGQAQKLPLVFSPPRTPEWQQYINNQPNTKAHSTRRQHSFHKNRAATLRRKAGGEPRAERHGAPPPAAGAAPVPTRLPPPPPCPAPRRRVGKGGPHHGLQDRRGRARFRPMKVGSNCRQQSWASAPSWNSDGCLFARRAEVPVGEGGGGGEGVAAGVGGRGAVVGVPVGGPGALALPLGQPAPLRQHPPSLQLQVFSYVSSSIPSPPTCSPLQQEP